MERKMKAIVINSYGSADVLEPATLDVPQVGAKQLLIEVHAAGINALDWKVRSGQLKIITRKKFPKVLGWDVSGKVVAVGKAVTKFGEGDEIFGMISALNFKPGGYAEYAVVRETAASKKPVNLSYVEAAAVPLTSLAALQALRDKVRLEAGQNILVNGAAGGVGTFGVQIAKVSGAKVTGVCSESHVHLVTSLGADRVIDYTKQDFVIDNPERYDAVLDLINNRKFSEYKRIMSSKGTYVTTVPNFDKAIFTAITTISPGRRCRLVNVKPNGKDLAWVKQEIEKGSIRPIIDSVYPLEEAAQAHKRSEMGHAGGKIVLKVRD